MADHPIAVGRATDAVRFLATDHLAWFDEVPSASVEEQALGLPRDQWFAADLPGADPSTYPGIYGVYPLTLAVPGPRSAPAHVPCAGLTWVGVHPDHRRKGVLTAMMRHHFEQVHEEPGTHVSALHASEPAIYGRHGYGLASLELEVTLGRGTSFAAPHLEDAAAATSTHLGKAADADVPKRMRECHLATAEVGAVVGEQELYARVCRELPEQARDKEPKRVLFARRDGIDVGFALFRRMHKWERGRPSGEVKVSLIVGDAAARLTLLRRLVDLDLMGSVSVSAVGAEDPLLLWTSGPRGASDVVAADSLWVRLVDLPEALQARSWSAPCDLVVEVDDRSAPWNEGRWRVHVDREGRAAVERSGAEADLRLGVDALGAAYVGGGNLVTLHRAGHVIEQRPGAVAELWRAMRADAVPAAAMMF